MSKIVILDGGIYLHRAVWASVRNPSVPSTFTAMSMIIGNLKRVGVDRDDKIILSLDGRNSWRRDFEKTYKGDRAKRKKESPIDWDLEYKAFNEFWARLNYATRWNIIHLDRIECDDIMAVICKHVRDKEIILLTYDSDMNQLWHYDNVKIFSPMSKKYKIKPKRFNVWNLISKKINKEASDNLVNPILSKEDYENREKCISLLNLPEWVENQILEAYNNLEEKEDKIEDIPFKSIRERYSKLYDDKSQVIDYEKQLAKEEKKKARKKLKKDKENVKKRRSKTSNSKN